MLDVEVRTMDEVVVDEERVCKLDDVDVGTRLDELDTIPDADFSTLLVVRVLELESTMLDDVEEITVVVEEVRVEEELETEALNW